MPVRLLQHRHEACRAEIARGEAHRIEQHAHFAPRAADDRRLRDQRDGFHSVVHFRHQPAKREMIVARAVKSERENRHVIDGLRLDQRRADSMRNTVVVRAQLFRQPHETSPLDWSRP